MNLGKLTYADLLPFPIVEKEAFMAQKYSVAEREIRHLINDICKTTSWPADAWENFTPETHSKIQLKLQDAFDGIRWKYGIKVMISSGIDMSWLFKSKPKFPTNMDRTTVTMEVAVKFRVMGAYKTRRFTVFKSSITTKNITPVGVMFDES